MNNRSFWINRARLFHDRTRGIAGGLIVALLIATARIGFGQSATWNLNPLNNDWNTAANWTPATVPEDVATFDVSDVTDVTISWPGASINEIIFNPGASAYSIGAGNEPLALYGAGVVSHSGVIQNFSISAGWTFSGTATAGDAVTYTVTSDGPTFFDGSSTAGTANFIVKGDSIDHPLGFIWFRDDSSAGACTMVNEAGDTEGGLTFLG